jgi:hypothetical protein
MAFCTVREHEHLLVVSTGVLYGLMYGDLRRTEFLTKANLSQQSYQSDTVTTVT